MKAASVSPESLSPILCQAFSRHPTEDVVAGGYADMLFINCHQAFLSLNLQVRDDISE